MKNLNDILRHIMPSVNVETRFLQVNVSYTFLCPYSKDQFRKCRGL